MITPVDLDLHVQRHAPFPSADPFTLTDEITGVPVDITGATITMQVRLYEGAAGDPLLDETLAVLNGPRGEFAAPGVTEAEHEALIAAALADGKTLQSALRLRYDIKAAGIPGFPSTVILARGFYIVQTGVTV
jgi:hypothetical protein